MTLGNFMNQIGKAGVSVSVVTSLAAGVLHYNLTKINRTTNKIMGTCGYYRGLETGTGELGCILLPMFRGQGIMTNAMKLAIDFGLNKIELNRIIAITSRKNQSAIKLLDRLNFIKVDDSLNEEIKFEFEAKLIKQ